jgi:hypothetical protein
MKLRRFDVLALLGLLTALTCVPLSAQRTSQVDERTSAVKEGEWVRVKFGGSEDQVIEGSLQAIEENDLLILSTEGKEVSRIQGLKSGISRSVGDQRTRLLRDSGSVWFRELSSAVSSDSLTEMTNPASSDSARRRRPQWEPWGLA